MINVMHSLSKPMNQMENCLDPQLWHACAGGMAQIPPPNSKVYYFPQGHAEHANENVDFMKFPRISPLVLCRVASIKYLADSESDEVFAKIRLVPLVGSDSDVCEDERGFERSEEAEKANSFAKTLTQSDANNGGGFSVPRYCAETIFPRLDYSAEPPVQTILAKDVHGVVWKFRHIYRGTPRRHLLTTGWSNFVNQKKLVAGDSIVFLRAENGDLCVGIRRAKRGIGGSAEVSCGWNTGIPALQGGFSGFLGESVGLGGRRGGGAELGLKERDNVKAEAVVEAVSVAANGQPFEVVYYPRAGSPEFVVRESAVRAALRVQWCSGMRFKMAFETEDSSRISWFMGTISAVQVDDPIHWPNSPWRLLQVVWDEPDLLHNVKRVNPWLVELVSTMAAGHSHGLSPFSPPRKRPRLPQPTEFPYGQFPMGTLVTNPLSPSSPLCCLPEHIPAGVQGARHARFEPPPSDLQYTKLQPFDFKLLDYAGQFPRLLSSYPTSSSSMKTGSSTKKSNEAKAPMFLLFGQPILTAEQISQSHSEGNNSSDGNQDNTANVSNGSGSAVIQNFPPEASSDGEFGMERSEMSSNVLYNDARGNTKHIGDEPFGDFIKNARRLTIVMDSGSVNLGN
ncbi:auxin response factor 18-like [Salvia hispanica]|uniref:auxin response factor 18-like n=1 Tax=Salvia hispanica TaxID=49212 RepID=UPI002009974D|nr:auxin response factor 18-like [Salvia hispanica]